MPIYTIFTRWQEVAVPWGISSDIMSFLLCWMYNECPKVELEHDFLRELKFAVDLLDIVDLKQFLEREQLSGKNDEDDDDDVQAQLMHGNG